MPLNAFKMNYNDQAVALGHKAPKCDTCCFLLVVFILYAFCLSCVSFCFCRNPGQKSLWQLVLPQNGSTKFFVMESDKQTFCYFLYASLIRQSRNRLAYKKQGQKDGKRRYRRTDRKRHKSPTHLQKIYIFSK